MVLWFRESAGKPLYRSVIIHNPLNHTQHSTQYSNTCLLVSHHIVVVESEIHTFVDSSRFSSFFCDTVNSPSLYSFDVRGRAFAKALYWSDPNSFGPRAYFLTVSKPATLSVDNVQLDDEGVSISQIFAFSFYAFLFSSILQFSAACQTQISCACSLCDFLITIFILLFLYLLLYIRFIVVASTFKTLLREIIALI